MIKIFTLFIIMFSFFTKGNAQYDQLATEFSFNDTEGKEISLADYKKKVILVGKPASTSHINYKDNLIFVFS